MTPISVAPKTMIPRCSVQRVAAGAAAWVLLPRAGDDDLVGAGDRSGSSACASSSGAPRGRFPLLPTRPRGMMGGCWLGERVSVGLYCLNVRVSCVSFRPRLLTDGLC